MRNIFSVCNLARILRWGRLLTAAGVASVACGAAAAEPAGSASGQIEVGPSDWPWWRGPTRDGVAPGRQNTPLAWSETENVVWRAEVPGRGHGSPIVVGDRVLLLAAEPDRQVQSVLCFDRKTGKRLWQAEVHSGGFTAKGNEKSSLASSTPACDGQRVFVNFLNADAIYTTALDLDGKQLWQIEVSDYVLHQGFGSSPAVHGSLVIVSADHKAAGSIVGLDRATGKVVWQQPRPKMPNYTSPIVLDVAGREQLLFTGCELVSSFDPGTGKKLWEIPGSTTECVTSTVTDGQHIFTSGGYPKNHLSAVRADGSGKIAWENNSRVYVPSMLVRDGYLYAVLDAGVATCWECETGRQVWQERIDGTFSSSLVMAEDRIFATNEAGHTYIFEASSKAFRLLAENQLGEEAMATPAICGDRIYTRVAVRTGDKRQEWLYCLGTTE